MTVCRHCSTTWTGLGIAHCAAPAGCCETFTSVSSFDKHRAAKYTEGAEYTRTSREGVVTTHRRKVEVRPGGECYDPADDGMIRNDRGQWAMPNTGYDFAARSDVAGTGAA